MESFTVFTHGNAVFLKARRDLLGQTIGDFIRVIKKRVAGRQQQTTNRNPNAVQGASSSSITHGTGV
jgi:hypothetical protein